MLERGENGGGLVIGWAGVMLKLGIVCAGGQRALEAELKPFQRWMARKIVPQGGSGPSPRSTPRSPSCCAPSRLLKSASLSDRQALEELLLRLGPSAPSAPAGGVADAVCQPSSRLPRCALYEV